MALANYTDLVAAINGWLGRADMTTIAPDLIALAEAEFNRRLSTPEMETRVSATIAGEALSLPTDFNGMRAVSIDDTKLEQVTPQYLFDINTTLTGTPYYFAISDGQIFFRPVSTTGLVTLDYYANVPALTALAPTNWLLTAHPDLYLFVSLMQAEFYNWDDKRIPIIKQRVEELFSQIEQNTVSTRYGGRTLVQRMPVESSIRIVAA
jgi:hypothetical protein